MSISSGIYGKGIAKMAQAKGAKVRGLLMTNAVLFPFLVCNMQAYSYSYLGISIVFLLQVIEVDFPLGSSIDNKEDLEKIRECVASQYYDFVKITRYLLFVSILTIICVDHLVLLFLWMYFTAKTRAVAVHSPVMVTAVHCDTPTSLMNPIHKIGPQIKEVR